jgi:hypothetical protein
MKMRTPACGYEFSNIISVMGAIRHLLLFKANSCFAFVGRGQGFSTLPAGLQNAEALASAAA